MQTPKPLNVSTETFVFGDLFNAWYYRRWYLEWSHVAWRHWRCSSVDPSNWMLMLRFTRPARTCRLPFKIQTYKTDSLDKIGNIIHARSHYSQIQKSNSASQQRLTHLGCRALRSSFLKSYVCTSRSSAKILSFIGTRKTSCISISNLNLNLLTRRAGQTSHVSGILDRSGTNDRANSRDVSEAASRPFVTARGIANQASGVEPGADKIKVLSAMDEDLLPVIQAIHKSPHKAVIYATGGGLQVRDFSLWYWEGPLDLDLISSWNYIDMESACCFSFIMSSNLKVHLCPASESLLVLKSALNWATWVDITWSKHLLDSRYIGQTSFWDLMHGYWNSAGNTFSDLCALSTQKVSYTFWSQMNASQLSLELKRKRGNWRRLLKLP